MYRAIPRLQEIFRSVYSWTDPESLSSLAPGPLRLKPFCLPMPHESVLEPYWSRGDRSGAVMVAGNKRAVLREGELYTERLRALSSLASSGAIDLWGRGWDRGLGEQEEEFGGAVRRSYRGPTPDKYETLSRYAVAICYENMILPGWITEKIFDCFYAGTVPVYWGAPNVNDFIPDECFIDRRSFADDAELQRFLEGLSEYDLRDYREAARSFLDSEAFSPFTAETFANRLIDDISSHMRERGLSGVDGS
jgi:hypothetical protein